MKKVKSRELCPNAVVQQAINDNIELIICHHPFIFASNINHSSIYSWKKQLYQKIKNNNLNVYSLHTNFDSDDKGMNVLMAQGLNLENINFVGQNKLSVVGHLPEKLPITTIGKNVKTYRNYRFNG